MAGVAGFLMSFDKFHHLAHDAAHHRRNAAETRRCWMGTPDLFADTDAAKPGA